MSDAEALMWRLDKDPALTGTYGNLTIVDRAPDFDRMRRRLERAATIIPRLHQRVQPSNVGPPQWVDDPLFHLDYHVRRIALPKPGTLTHLHELATLIVLDPFERTRPLWQIVVIEGLRGGRAGVLQKMHHSVGDGEAGVRFLLEFLDFERDAPEPPPATHQRHPGDHAGRDTAHDTTHDVPVDPDDTGYLPRPDVSEEPPGTSSESPSDTDVPSGSRSGPTASLAETLTSSLRMPISLLRQVRDLVSDPAGNARSAETVRLLLAQLTDLGKAQSPLWTRRSLRRHLETLRTPLHAAKQAAKTLGGPQGVAPGATPGITRGGTLNTAFLAAVSDGVGAYHRECGAPIDTLRASMAISVRTESSGTNAFTLARLTVPTGEMSLRDRFAIIHEQATQARVTSMAAPLERLAPFAAALPAAVIMRIARAQSQTVDFATSNLRGSPIPVFIAGSEVLANFPLGPLAGVAFNLTAMSYGDSLDMGLHVDPAAVEHPALLCRHLEQAFKRLARAR